MTPLSQQFYLISEDELNIWQSISSMSPMNQELRQCIRSRPYNPASERRITSVDVMSEIEQARVDERGKVLDVGVILDSLCNVDLYWYSRGNCESEDVRKCRGKDCNYCGRHNEELRTSKEEQG